MVYKWFADFKRGRTSTLTIPSTGRPKEATTPENIRKVYDLVHADRKITVCEIAEIVRISPERIYNILTEELHMKKLCAKWIPRELTPLQKLRRVSDSEACLKMLRHNRWEFFNSYVTMDETWVHHYSPGSKKQTAQWVHEDESGPTQAKRAKSAGKVMASVFWDIHGILLIDYLPPKETINSDYYVNLLDKLDEAIKQKRPRKSDTKIIFHQDNAPCHTSAKTMAKLHQLGYKVLPHPPYSPDIAPSDYYLFSDLKNSLANQRYSNNEEVMAAVNDHFEGKEEMFYKKGIERLEDRWSRCITIEGDYLLE